jgi:hypothetical protein
MSMEAEKGGSSSISDRSLLMLRFAECRGPAITSSSFLSVTEEFVRSLMGLLYWEDWTCVPFPDFVCYLLRVAVLAESRLH